MSSGVPNLKKRKTDDTNISMSTIKQTVQELRDDRSFRIYYGFDEFISACEKKEEEVFRVINSNYYASTKDFGHYVTPRNLQRFTTTRDDRSGRIIRIHDGVSRLDGPGLDRIMAIDHLKTNGFDVVIFMPKESQSDEVLALPRNWELDEDVVSKKRDHIKSIFRLYHVNGFSRVYATRSQLYGVLKLDYITLRRARSVSIKLNGLVEKQEFDPDFAKLTSLKEILKRDSAEAKTLEKTFVGELLACAVTGADWKTKISAFKKDPSANLARLLELKKPYQGKLYSQSTQRVAETCMLRDLGDDDMVLFSSVSLDTKFYNSISGDIKDWNVYKASSDLGILKDKKGWKALVEPIEISAKLTYSLLKAIASSNSTEKSSSGEVVLQDYSEKLLDDIDI